MLSDREKLAILLTVDSSQKNPKNEKPNLEYFLNYVIGHCPSLSHADILDFMTEYNKIIKEIIDKDIENLNNVEFDILTELKQIDEKNEENQI